MEQKPFAHSDDNTDWETGCSKHTPLQAMGLARAPSTAHLAAPAVFQLFIPAGLPPHSPSLPSCNSSSPEPRGAWLGGRRQLCSSSSPPPAAPGSLSWGRLGRGCCRHPQVPQRMLPEPGEGAAAQAPVTPPRAAGSERELIHKRNGSQQSASFTRELSVGPLESEIAFSSRRASERSWDGSWHVFRSSLVPSMRGPAVPLGHSGHSSPDTQHHGAGEPFTARSSKQTHVCVSPSSSKLPIPPVTPETHGRA